MRGSIGVRAVLSALKKKLYSRPIWGKEKSREKKSKRFLTAGAIVACNRNPKGNFCHIFVNKLKIMSVRPTKILINPYINVCG